MLIKPLLHVVIRFQISTFAPLKTAKDKRIAFAISCDSLSN